jgi:TolB-like protein
LYFLYLARIFHKIADMSALAAIICDLGAFELTLRFHGDSDLVVHFDTPSRRFYLSVIALIISEMKKPEAPQYTYIRKHRKMLHQLDEVLSGKHASKDADGMWAKINMAWRHRLPDLEAAALFKVRERDLFPPYEKGAKYRYDCSEKECDAWAGLFGFDIGNKWRFNFATNNNTIGIEDISIIFGELRDNAAWAAFVKGLDGRVESESSPERSAESSNPWKNIAIALAVLLIAVVVAVAYRKALVTDAPQEMALTLPDKPAIAVLPFKNLSTDPSQEYFCDGLAEEIISALSSVPDIFVIARTSTATYKGQSATVQQIGRELGVRYVLEGSVRLAGDQLRITAQLVDALDGHHLWAQRYNRNLSDLFAVQDEITQKIITAMQVELTEGEQIKIAAKGTKNLDAYLKYLRAMGHIAQFTAEHNALAKQLAQQAIALDPQYAMAYRVLAVTHRMDVWLGTSPSVTSSRDNCLTLLERAISLDPAYAEAYSEMAFSLTELGQHEQAVATAERAVMLQPNSATAHAMLAHALRFSGRPDQAIFEYHKAIRLNPIPPAFYYFGLADAYNWTDQFEEAIRWGQKAIQKSPDAYLPHLILTVVYSRAGMEYKARRQAAQVMRTNPKYNLVAHERRATHKNKASFFEALRRAGLK